MQKRRGRTVFNGKHNPISRQAAVRTIQPHQHLIHLPTDYTPLPFVACYDNLAGGDGGGACAVEPEADTIALRVTSNSNMGVLRMEYISSE